MRPSAFLLAALLATPAVLRGQNAAPDAGALRLGADTLAVFVIQGADTTATGLVVDQLAVRTDGGRSLLVRTYLTQDRVLGARLDTLVDEFPHLAPVRHRSRTDQGFEHLDFANGRVQGTLYLANGDSVPVDVALPSPVINASTFDIALRSTTLSEGWSAEFSAFLPSSRTVVTLHARVAGVEEIGGSSCWRVEAEFTGLPVTFWIDQSTRRICQQVMVIRPDFRILFAPQRATRGSTRAT